MASKRQQNRLLSVVVLAIVGTAWLCGVSAFLAPQPLTSRPDAQQLSQATGNAAASSNGQARFAAAVASSATALALAAQPALASYDGEAYRYDDRAGLATGWLFGLIFAGVAITGGFVYVFTRPGMFDDNK
eukprot:TRINITY_DN4025_c1_g1_i1.p1 TRINITY_DN4025_c1_g1~~TRINITY_DN4025_c1_g1_i1.p1  ORF type:complete len:131 (+),score=27.33 TRINITY_DN4025_c1_g1_i1:72-464(+)